MKKTKRFDAVEMKNAIQAKHRRQRAGLSDEQVRRAIAERLDTLDHPLSHMWRRLTPDRANQSPAAKT